jgi:hypothetical protein
MSVQFDGKRFSKTHDPESWWMESGQNETRSLDESMSLFGRTPPSIVSQGQRDAYGSLTSSEIPWMQAIGKEKYLSVVKSAHSSVVDWLQDESTKKYVDTHIKCRSLLMSLEPASIDAREFEARRKSPSVESFIPTSGRFAAVPRYSQVTQTGRLKVIDGPKILTISKADRRVISSRFSGGRILQVDYVSLEPRVALYTAGVKPDGEDVYDWISRSIGGGHSRSKVKVPTLSVLYGQGSKNDDPVSSSIREEVKRVFKIDELMQRLRSEGNTNGFGRPLEDCEDRLLIPHYTQSTAVDVALLGFNTLIQELGSHVGNGIVPIFVLHDALILDVSPELYGHLRNRVSMGVEVSPLGRFPLSLGPIWDE